MKGWDNFIVTENKSCSNTRERYIVSALNIIVTSINRASKITEIATREEFRNHKAHGKLIYYAWVDKQRRPDKMRSRSLNASNLPWRSFADYARSNFAEGFEYDDGKLTEHWEKRLNKMYREGDEAGYSKRSLAERRMKDALRIWLIMAQNSQDETSSSNAWEIKVSSDA